MNEFWQAAIFGSSFLVGALVAAAITDFIVNRREKRRRIKQQIEFFNRSKM